LYVLNAQETPEGILGEKDFLLKLVLDCNLEMMTDIRKKKEGQRIYRLRIMHKKKKLAGFAELWETCQQQRQKNNICKTTSCQNEMAMFQWK
jgi:hypothetical protein